jgi:hypothetical protein
MDDYVEDKKLENTEGERPSARERFLVYHAECPVVWEMFKKFTYEALNAGCKNIGSKMIVERIRWETNVMGNDGFKINNDHAPYYARVFMELFPEHDGFFRTRVCKDEDIFNRSYEKNRNVLKKLVAYDEGK